jgi:hypothetical protein
VVGGFLIVVCVALIFLWRPRSRRRRPSKPVPSNAEATEYPHYTADDFGKAVISEPEVGTERKVAVEPYAGSHLKFPARKNAA